MGGSAGSRGRGKERGKLGVGRGCWRDCGGLQAPVSSLPLVLRPVKIVFARPPSCRQTLSSVLFVLIAFPKAWLPLILAGQRIEALRELSLPKCLHSGKWWGMAGGNQRRLPGCCQPSPHPFLAACWHRQRFPVPTRDLKSRVVLGSPAQQEHAANVFARANVKKGNKRLTDVRRKEKEPRS